MLFLPENQLFPLHLYDDKVFEEKLIIPSDLTVKAIVLIRGGSSAGPESRPDSPISRDKVLGTWYFCEVIGRDDNGDLNVNLGEDEVVVHPMFVCFASFQLEIYASRILQALERRAHCTALMKYFFTIKHMPYDESIVSCLDDDHIEKIVNRARSMKKLTYDYLMPCLVQNVEESKVEYENCMKKLIFDSSVLSRSQFSIFAELNVPLPIVMVRPKSSIWGRIPAQQYKQHVTLRNYESDGYFS